MSSILTYLTDCLCLEPTFAGKLLRTSQLTADPPGVSLENVKLSVLVGPETAIPKGALVELTLPEGGEVSFSGSAVSTPPTCDLLGLSSPQPLPCKVEAAGSTQKITWTTVDFIPRASSVQFEALSGFNNPKTTEPTATFVLMIYEDATK